MQGELYTLSKQRGYPNVYICGQHLDSLSTKSTGRWLRSRLIAGLRGWDREDMRSVRLIPSDSLADGWEVAVDTSSSTSSTEGDGIDTTGSAVSHTAVAKT